MNEHWNKARISTITTVIDHLYVEDVNARGKENKLRDDIVECQYHYKIYHMDTFGKHKKIKSATFESKNYVESYKLNITQRLSCI